MAGLPLVDIRWWRDFRPSRAQVVVGRHDELCSLDKLRNDDLDFTLFQLRNIVRIEKVDTSRNEIICFDSIAGFFNGVGSTWEVGLPVPLFFVE